GAAADPKFIEQTVLLSNGSGTTCSRAVRAVVLISRGGSAMSLFQCRSPLPLLLLGLTAICVPVMGEIPPDTLTATWIGDVGDAAVSSVALSWHGKESTSIEIFEDRDGNLKREEGERIVVQRLLTPGVTVVDLPVRDPEAVLVASAQNRSEVPA